MELSENRAERLNPDELVSDHHDCYLTAALQALKLCCIGWPNKPYGNFALV